MSSESKPLFFIGNNVNGQGSPVLAWSQDCSMVAICGMNSKNIYILDKRGKKIKETVLNNNNSILKIEWDKDNELICVLQSNMNSVSIWNIVQNKIEQMDLDNQKSIATYIFWSKTNPVLAVGTDKGNLIFYNKRNQKKITTMGKHGKKIFTGEWNQDGFLSNFILNLVTGSEENMLTISNYTSDTKFESFRSNIEFRNLKWLNQKTDNRNEKQDSIIYITKQNRIQIKDMSISGPATELLFDEKYGKLIDYKLFGDGYILCSFQDGYVNHLSTHVKEIKQEIQNLKVFNSIDAIATNDYLYKLAVCGDGQIKFYNMSNWQEVKNEKIILPKNIGRVSELLWSANGQTLLVTANQGAVIGFTTSMPYMYSDYKQMAAVMISFTEIAIYNLMDQKFNQIGKIDIDFEPQSISLGQNTIGISSGNQAYYYYWGNNQTNQLIMTKEFPSQIKRIQTNQNYSCALLDSGKLIIHSIKNTSFEKKFPQNEYEKQQILQFQLTQNFLIFIDQSQKLKFYNINDQAIIIDFKKDDIVMQRLYSNANGTKLIIIDNNSNGYLFNSKDESLIKIENWFTQTLKVVWDSYESNLFYAIQDEKLYPFIITQSLQGVKAIPVPEILSTKDQNPQFNFTILDRSIKPIQFSQGYLFFLTQQGTIQAQALSSHSHINNWNSYSTKEQHLRCFFQNLSLNKLSHCLMISQILNDLAIFLYLGKKALENIQIDIAQAAYQKAKNLSIVMAINSFQNQTEKNILYGHIAMMLSKYDLAQDLFLKSSKPQLALDMRCDIQDWITALKLAKQIDPKQEPLICKRLATQIESQGNNHEAQRLFQKSFLQQEDNLLSKQNLDIHNTQCYAGIARTSIKLGDISRGFQYANDLKDNQMIIDIAMVCENMKQYLEAAQLYEKAGLIEKAAGFYIQLKMFKQIIPLMKKIKSPKLLIQLAKAKEAEQSYLEAEQAFEQAEDWENVLRLNLNQLNDIDKAKWVVRNKNKSANCASIISNYCVKKGEHKEAIEFLLLAEKKQEAFLLAQGYDEIQAYTEGLKDITPQEILQIAQYFEGKSMWPEAANYYEKYGNQTKALKLYKQAGEDYIETMIQMIGKANKDNLTNNLLSYLMGEDEYGEPKDPIYTYKVYKILKLFKQSAKIALTIASQEQESGDFNAAHKMLYETFKDMKQNNVKIPVEISNKLMILHSYLIVKRIIKQGDHDQVSWILNRVCKNISQFQQFAVNILTTTVIESIKANLKELAYSWSCVLVRPEYRQQITEKYKAKIEQIARKAVTVQNEMPKSPCPFCQELLGAYDLDCQICQNQIPYCIASGRHILKDQCVFCYNCGFPSNLDSLQISLQIENTCPMCQCQIEQEKIIQDSNVIEKLRAWIKVGDDEKQ